MLSLPLKEWLNSSEVSGIFATALNVLTGRFMFWLSLTDLSLLYLKKKNLSLSIFLILRCLRLFKDVAPLVVAGIKLIFFRAVCIVLFCICLRIFSVSQTVLPAVEECRRSWERRQSGQQTPNDPHCIMLPEGTRGRRKRGEIKRRGVTLGVMVFVFLSCC